MRKIVISRYGSPDVLELREVEMPQAADDEALVRVRAASVNPYDWHLMTGLPYLGRVRTGLRTPVVTGLGADFAGQVEAVGPEVTGLSPGDEVFGQVNGEVPGMPMLDLASFGEYVTVREASVARKPANLSFAQAAAVPMAGLTALQTLRDKGRVGPGQAVLVNGASGGVGTFAVQVAVALGAEVTGVGGPGTEELVRSLGAARDIDYTRENFAREGRLYDVMLDNVGNRSLADCRRVLTPKGIYIASFGQPQHRWLGPLPRLLRTLLLSRVVGQTLTAHTTARTRADLEALAELIEAGAVTPVIDRTYPLSEVPEALRYLERGHARGKVVITV